MEEGKRTVNIVPFIAESENRRGCFLTFRVLSRDPRSQSVPSLETRIRTKCTLRALSPPFRLLYTAVLVSL